MRGTRFTSRTRPPARWHEAEAMLGSGAGRAGRADARIPLMEAVDTALMLGALLLLRELRELAGRALIQLPPEVDAALTGPDDRPRELVGVIAPAPVVAAMMPVGADGSTRQTRGNSADRSSHLPVATRSV